MRNQLLDSTINNHVFQVMNESDAAYQLVSDELILDGNSRQNLATFVKPGWVTAISIRSPDGAPTKENMIDKTEITHKPQKLKTVVFVC